MSSIYGTLLPDLRCTKGPNDNVVEHAAIKSSIIQLTRYFAQYFKNENIRVNCLAQVYLISNQNLLTHITPIVMEKAC